MSAAGSEWVWEPPHWLHDVSACAEWDGSTSGYCETCKCKLSTAELDALIRFEALLTRESASYGSGSSGSSSSSARM